MVLMQVRGHLGLEYKLRQSLIVIVTKYLIQIRSGETDFGSRICGVSPWESGGRMGQSNPCHGIQNTGYGRGQGTG